MSRMPPLNAMRSFEAAARHLSFTRAADELFVTQAAISHQVKALEQDLGVMLFKRLNRNLKLTEEGQALLPFVRSAFEQLSSGVRELERFCAGGTLTVTAPPTFAGEWLVPRLGEFMEGHPDLDVRVVAGQGLANFQSDGVDVAVRQGRPPFGPGLSAELLFPFDVYPVCSPTLQAGKHPIEKPEDLAQHVLLHDAHGLWPLFLEQVSQGQVATH